MGCTSRDTGVVLVMLFLMNVWLLSGHDYDGIMKSCGGHLFYGVGLPLRDINGLMAMEHIWERKGGVGNISMADT